ncbi:MAG: hypothetical protein HY900_35275 [Deltaproteobacteria bacterium]|nr:hypothetical protein [Deltaproteobacteria bacterium]
MHKVAAGLHRRVGRVLAPCAAILLSCLAASAPAEEASLRVQTGLGYDTNPFLTPASYFDPILGRKVQTEKHPGVFVPVSLRAATGAAVGGAGYLLDLRLSGEKYLSRPTRNADNYQAVLDLEGQYRLKKVGRHWARLRLSPSLAFNREIFVDPDTGEKETSTGVDLADRFNYWRASFQADLEAPLTARTELDLRASAARYDYEEIGGVSSLDNVYYTVGAAYEVELLDSLGVRLGYTFGARNYDERPARDRNGDLVAGEERRYFYHEVRAQAEHRLSSALRLRAAYARRQRIDRFVGYDDNTRNEYRLTTTYADKEERRFRVGLTYWDRRYPRAFIFDVTPAEVAAGALPAGVAFTPRHKAYKVWEAEAAGEFPLTDRVKAWVSYTFEDEDVRDPRFEYERHRVSSGLKATF